MNPYLKNPNEGPTPEEQEQAEIDLQQRFPKMKPIKGVPPLGRIFGIGFGMYGNRDVDPETGACVKTHCFSVLLIPLFTLGAYRVADTQQGMYFLGKEPMSGFAKIWNLIVLVAIAGVIGSASYSNYITSPPYLANQRVDAGEAALRDQDPIEAAEEFRIVISNGAWPMQAEAKDGMKRALRQLLDSGDYTQIRAALSMIDQLGNRALRPEPLAPDAVNVGRQFAEKHAETNAAEALLLLKHISAIAPRDVDLSEFETALLVKAVEQDGDNVDLAVRLAGVYERTDKLDLCMDVLEPIRDQLGDGEGARVLGYLYVKQGNLADAIPQLQAYVSARMPKLHDAEKNIESAAEAAYERAIRRLENDSSFMRKYDRASSEAEQAELVNEAAGAKMEKDLAYQRAIKALEQANEVVPVAFELGVAQLQHAQTLASEAERQGGFEAAEKTFVSLESSAGGSDEYRIFRGQVAFWLGKEEEGKEQFNVMLEASNRSWQHLMLVINAYRELGEFEVAKTMAAEAYEKASNEEEKFGSAYVCALTSNDTEERIDWLSKSDQNSPNIIIELHTSRSDLAAENGDNETALKELRLALTGYEKMGENTSSLNNWALAQFDLFNLTGDPADFAKGASMIERAVEQSPNDGIVLTNAVSALYQSALISALAEHYDIKALEGTASAEMMSMLYNSDVAREPYLTKLKSSPDMTRCRELLGRALLVAPKSLGIIAMAMQQAQLLRDDELAQQLLEKMADQEYDTSTSSEETVATYKGDNDAESIDDLQTGLTNLQELLAKQAPDSLEADYVQIQIFETQMGLANMNQDVDLEALRDAAVAIHARRQASTTRATTTGIHYQLADAALSSANSGYRDARENFRRGIDARQRVIWALWQEPYREAVLADSNFQAALAMERETRSQFPARPDTMDWALFQIADPAIASQVAGKAKHAGAQLANVAGIKLAPLSQTAILRQHFHLKLAGDDAGAEKVISDVRDNPAVPWP